MRVTDNIRMVGLLRTNATSSGRLNTASRRASAGARVVLPSDDPVSYTTAVRRGSTLVDISSRTRTARTASDELSIAERALEATTELMSEAKSLAVQGANDTLSPADRKTLAQRVVGLREQVLQLANTRGASGYLFAGSRTDVAPFDNTGTFQGNDTVMRVAVTDGISSKMNVSGARAFTSAGGRDVLADLSALATALDTNDITAIRSGMDNVQAGYDQIVAVQVDAGLTMERLRSAADVLDESSLAIEQGLARDIGADTLVDLATELSAASSAYSQSLEVTRRLLALPSLASG